MYRYHTRGNASQKARQSRMFDANSYFPKLLASHIITRLIFKAVITVAGTTARANQAVTWDDAFHSRFYFYPFVKQKLICIFHMLRGSRDSAVGIATDYGLNDREVGVGFPVRSRIFCSPCCPDRLWGSPSLLSNGYGGAPFPGGKAARALSWPLTSN
jgi:hypothetical protein